MTTCRRISNAFKNGAFMLRNLSTPFSNAYTRPSFERYIFHFGPYQVYPEICGPQFLGVASSSWKNLGRIFVFDLCLLWVQTVCGALGRHSAQAPAAGHWSLDWQFRPWNFRSCVHIWVQKIPYKIHHHICAALGGCLKRVLSQYLPLTGQRLGHTSTWSKSLRKVLPAMRRCQI